MKEDFWDFVATHKIILCTNHLPKIRGQDKAMWRRLAVWPFIQAFWDSDKGETGPPEFKADNSVLLPVEAALDEPSEDPFVLGSQFNLERLIRSFTSPRCTMNRRKPTPSYRLHKQTGKAIVTVYDADGCRRGVLLPGE